MFSLFNILAKTVSSVAEFCNSASGILRIVGWVYVGIEIVVPIILIFMGMFDLAKAVTEKDENKIKAAQQLLVKRAIAAALVFLVAALVGLIMRIVGNDDYKKCSYCMTSPWSEKCKDTDPFK